MANTVQKGNPLGRGGPHAIFLRFSHLCPDDSLRSSVCRRRVGLGRMADVPCHHHHLAGEQRGPLREHCSLRRPNQSAVQFCPIRDEVPESFDCSQHPLLLVPVEHQSFLFNLFPQTGAKSEGPKSTVVVGSGDHAHVILCVFGHDRLQVSRVFLLIY